jgi:hypothetical protein
MLTRHMSGFVCFYGTTRRVLARNVTVAAGVFSADPSAQQFSSAARHPYRVPRAIPTGEGTNYVGPDERRAVRRS